MTVTLDIDLEKFRYSLVGDGFRLEEVKAMSRSRLIEILTYRINDHIEEEYRRSIRYGLLKGSR